MSISLTFLYLKLIKQFESNEKNAVKLLKSFELHFIPLINPDGYEYSRASKVILKKIVLYLHLKLTFNSLIDIGEKTCVIQLNTLQTMSVMELI